MQDVVVVAACRTAQGSFGGTLRDVAAHELSSAVVREVVRRAGLGPDQVDAAAVGQVYQSSQALNIGRYTALEAELAVETAALGINTACCSGLEAINAGVREVMVGQAGVFVAAGVESMSGAPFRLEGHRWGTRRGHSELIDQFEESTWSASTYRFGRFNMGMAADHVAGVYGISRQEQDEFAYRSHKLAVAAIESGVFKDEIVPVTVARKKGDIVFQVDEHPRADVSLEGLSRLRPAFQADGTVTAGNSSGVNDGAAAVVLMAAARARELGVRPIARVRSTARVGVHPRLLCMSPGPAADLALRRAGLSVADIGLWELNEAFAAVVLAGLRDLKMPLDRVNVHGGGISLGHPVGCSGCRIVVSLLHAMRRQGVPLGLASIGGGGGIGTAIVLELCD